MRTYDEARALVGTTMVASVTNGRTKRLKFIAHGDAVLAVLFETPVVTFHPGHVEVRTGGYVTPTTFDGISAALDEPRFLMGTTKRVPHLLGRRMTEGMLLGYDGKVVADSDTETPLGPGRK